MTARDNNFILHCLVCQVRVPKTLTAAARDTHLYRLAKIIDHQLSVQHADLVVLPELSAISYSRQTFAQLDVLSESDDDASFHFFSPVARKHAASILYGFARRGRRRPRISMGLINADGCFGGAYDKLHLCQYGASMEKDYFEPGDSLFVFDIGGVSVAPIICYDIRFAELSQTLCQRYGARVLVHCCANYRDQSFHSWRNFVITRAMENQVHLLSINRAGGKYGGSMLCPPWHDSNHRLERLTQKEIFVHWEICLDQAERVRKDYPFLVDRRDYPRLPIRQHGVLVSK